jgi:hypothetical protein
MGRPVRAEAFICKTTAIMVISPGDVHSLFAGVELMTI